MVRRVAAAVAAIALLLPTTSQPASDRKPAAAVSAVQPVTITGVDSHDGQIYEDGGVFYWAGTRYGCGFVWMNPAAPWCGFGVWTAPALAGPWTYIRDLFDPAGTSAPQYFSESWQTICRGDGCFNPRMMRRPDGAWILWFNAPRDMRVHGGNQFWAMGCNGPAGPCGAAAGPPYGSTIKPHLWVCNTGGDFSTLADVDGQAYLVCGTSAYTVSIERLAPWWADGTGAGATNLAGVQWVEGTGMFRTGDGQYVLTFGANCAYCSGTDTSYAVASSPLGPFVRPPGGSGRKTISGHSCGGQPRTVTVIGGQAYQQIDHWYDALNETNAATSLIPLVQVGPLLAAPNGSRWAGGFAAFDCAA